MPQRVRMFSQIKVVVLIEDCLATIPLIFLFFAFYDIAYTPMLVAYTLEILPFSIRAKGFAIMVCFH